MNSLIEKTEQFVVDLLNESLAKNFVYHNIAHTQRVVEKTLELIEGETFSEVEKQSLLLAAWFHDAGFTVNPDNHEEESVAIATNFLNNEGVSDEIIDEVSRLIAITKMGVSPSTEVEKILKDADCSHVGSKNYSDFNELLRKERELVCDRTIKDVEWDDANLNFLTKHRFYTSKASKLWEKQKSKNIAQL